MMVKRPCRLQKKDVFRRSFQYCFIHWLVAISTFASDFNKTKQNQRVEEFWHGGHVAVRTINQKVHSILTSPTLKLLTLVWWMTTNTKLNLLILGTWEEGPIVYLVVFRSSVFVFYLFCFLSYSLVSSSCTRFILLNLFDRGHVIFIISN